MSWGVTLETHRQVHGPHCTCDPDSALRLQTLRLLHAFADTSDAPLGRPGLERADPQRLLLTEREQERGERGEKSEDKSEATKAQAAEEAEEGVVSVVVRVLRQEPPTSPFRFWLTSCVEAFLRSAQRTRGQKRFVALFAGGAGIVAPLVAEILARAPPERPSATRGSAETSAETFDEASVGGGAGSDGNAGGGADGEADRHCTMQTACDLLGEGAKFCPATVAAIDAALLASPNGHSTFLRSVQSHLVDANVLYRAVVLTVAARGPSGETPKPLRTIRLTGGAPSSRGPGGATAVAEAAAAAVSDDAAPGAARDAATGTERVTDLSVARLAALRAFVAASEGGMLTRLMAVVPADTVSHENICVLNTGLVLCLLAHRRGELAALLARADAEAGAAARAEAGTADARAAFSEDRRDAGGVNAGGEDAGGAGLGVDTAAAAAQDALKAAPDALAAAPDASAAAARLNFRRLLWFWREYYGHRGRDRASLEQSSRLPFKAWAAVVDLLCADDGAPTALLASPPRLPPSPYAAVPTLLTTAVPRPVPFPAQGPSSEHGTEGEGQ